MGVSDCACCLLHCELKVKKQKVITFSDITCIISSIHIYIYIYIYIAKSLDVNSSLESIDRADSLDL